MNLGRLSSACLRVVVLALALVAGCGEANDPDPCAAGTFDADGDATTACVAWSTCAAGEYVAASGSPTADRECSACGTGTFSATTNATACAAFTDCVAGEYEQASGAPTVDRLCTTCGTGTYSTTTNASMCMAVTLCMPGNFVSAAGTSTANQVCSPCATGSFAAGTNAAACVTHANCLPGTLRATLGTPSADTVCDPCAAESFSTGTNAATCEPWTMCEDRFVEGEAGSAVLDRTCVAEEWNPQVGTATDDEAIGVVLDAEGNAYVVGRVTGALAGELHLGETDGYLQKFDPDGALLWTEQFGTAGFDMANAVALDDLGHVYVVGQTKPDILDVGQEVVLRKYTTDGVLVWTVPFGSDLADYARAVAVDTDGNPYFLGVIEGVLDGNDPTPGAADIVVRRFDVDGDVTWTRVLTSTADTSCGGLFLTDTRVYIAGWTTGALPGETNAGDALDGIAIALSLTDGSDVWARQLGTTGSEFATDVVVDASGTVYVTGHSTSTFGAGPRVGGLDIFVVALDDDGADLWATMFGSTSSDFASAIALDPAGGVVVAGSTTGTFAGQVSAGSQDIVVARVSADGTLGALRQLGTTSGDVARDVAVDADGVPHAVGYVTAALPGQTALGGQDAYLMRLAL